MVAEMLAGRLKASRKPKFQAFAAPLEQLIQEQDVEIAEGVAAAGERAGERSFFSRQRRLRQKLLIVRKRNRQLPASDSGGIRTDWWPA